MSTKRKIKKPRNMEALGSILKHKGGPMRDRRKRRQKEKDSKLNNGNVE